MRNYRKTSSFLYDPIPRRKIFLLSLFFWKLQLIDWCVHGSVKEIIFVRTTLHVPSSKPPTSEGFFAVFVELLWKLLSFLHHLRKIRGWKMIGNIVRQNVLSHAPVSRDILDRFWTIFFDTDFHFCQFLVQWIPKILPFMTLTCTPVNMRVNAVINLKAEK